MPAAGSGLTREALYYYYRNRSEILLAIIEPQAAGLINGLKADVARLQARAQEMSGGGVAAPAGEFVSFPGSPFQLFQPYPPAGDQPTAIAQLVEGVNDGEVFQTLLGVTGSGKTFTMANVIARLGRPAR